MDKFNELREKYPTFEYRSYKIEEFDDRIEVTYFFETLGLVTFAPKWIFPKINGVKLEGSCKEIFENVIFNLGMVEAISYIKATCSPSLKVNAGYLEEDQIKWYKKLYKNGLGEFAYRNGIVEGIFSDDFLEITTKEKFKFNNNLDETLSGNLIPVGGGKDSALTLEVLKNEDNMCYIVNPRGASYKCAEIAGYDDARIYTPKRILDKKIIELNNQGFLNGHTPFSAVLAFSSYAAALLLKKKYIVLSNESSANEANVKDTNINHQYSKSIEFENDFREYTKKYLCQDGPQYFSLLRPLTEWQIVKGFVKQPKYFEIFKSCNVGSKDDIWCENCPKCLYVYIMLKAFLDDKNMRKIFKKDLLDESNLENIFNGLIYPNYDKPFECVGTKEEVNLSVNIIVNDLLKSGKEIPYLLKNFRMNIEDIDSAKQSMSNRWEIQNNLNEHFENVLKRYIM